jgi:ERCC4-type nuclease
MKERTFRGGRFFCEGRSNQQLNSIASKLRRSWGRKRENRVLVVRGIGPKLAERIVAAFGEATFEVIEASPEKLREVPGIGEFGLDPTVASPAAKSIQSRF